MIAPFLFGLFIWTLIEYVVHGCLGHQLDTPIWHVHQVHHRNEHAVFAVRAWFPILVVFTTSLIIFGLGRGMMAFCGVLAGFLAYEAIHFHLHFRRAKSLFGSYLRARHLMHHRRPGGYFGVTNPIWDLVFGTEPLTPRDEWSSCVEAPPLEGRTNLQRLFEAALHPFRIPAR